MKVIVISYKRLGYLERTLASLDQPGIRTYVCDAGTTPQSQTLIERYATDYIAHEDRWTADEAKNAGIEAFAGDDEFVVISSDDYVYPGGFAEAVLKNWTVLRPRGYAAIACNYTGGNPIEDTWWANEGGVWVLPAGALANTGMAIDVRAVRDMGGYPVIGLTGAGDWVIGVRLQALGLKGCYVRSPVIDHIGVFRKEDYPEYSAEFEPEDAKSWQQVMESGEAHP